MSEHAWSQEQLAAYVAGGLDAAEAERFEAHVRDCPACTEALARARRLDGGMSALFATARPRPDLDDRALQALRAHPAEPARLTVSRAWTRRALIAAVLAIVVTAGGIVGTHLDTLHMPGNAVKFATGPKPVQSPSRLESVEGLSDLFFQPDYANFDKMVPEKGLTNEDLGLQTNLEAALPGLERVDKQTVDATVTQGNLGQPNAPATDPAAVKLQGLPSTDKPLAEIDSDRKRSTDLGDKRSMSAPGSDRGRGRAAVSLNPYYPPDKQILSFAMDQYGYSNGTVAEPKPAASKPSVPGTSETTPPRIVLPLDPFPPTPATPATVTQPAPAPAPVSPAKTIVIRTGEIDYEIDSFDAAAAGIAAIVKKIPGAFIATINSEKLANGKVTGSITVRLPPEALDGLVLDIRRELGKGGDLRGSRISALDITKQYTDLESRLKAAQAMKERLTQIIKEGGKGDIKGLVEAEHELGTWQTKIEEYEGELRFYANRVALSTLKIGLTEKEFRAAADLTENERIQAGLEVEDVEKAQRQILAAVADAKGRVTKSEMKQHGAGQFSAILNFEMAPEAAGPLRDRLNQIGRVARLEIDRVQSPAGAVTKNAKVQRGDTLFLVQLYNLTAIAPREVAVEQIAVTDVPTAYQSLRESVAKANGRVLLAELTKQDQQNVTAKLDFEVRRADEPVLRAAVDALGEVLSRQVAHAAEGDNVTDAKVMFRIAFVAVNSLKPREKTTLGLEVADVDQSIVVFRVQAEEVGGRQVDSQFTKDRAGQLMAKVTYEVPLTAAKGLADSFKTAGAVRQFQSTRDPSAPEGKYATARLEVTLSNAERIVAADEGLWPQVKRGLTYSVQVLLTSVTWVVFGLCVVVPWAVIGYALVRAGRWLVRSRRNTTVTSAEAS